MKRKMDDIASIISEITKEDSPNESQVSEVTMDTMGYGGKAEAKAFKRRKNS